MEQVGDQVNLPFSRALQIAVQGIRIRLGRSLVTLSGVVLGIAFLMSSLTAQLINRAVARERDLRQTVNLMETVVKSEVGRLTGKYVGVVTCGTLSAAEQGLISRLQSAATLGPVGPRAAAILILGNARSCPAAVPTFNTPVVLDSLATRQFSQPLTIRRELLFGNQLSQQQDKLRLESARERFRTIWIVLISLFVTVIGVANALLMSVTERFREIGTMKCLGALSSFIRTLFLIESSLIGFAGSVLGVLVGMLLTMLAYGFTYSFAQVFGGMAYGLLALAGGGAVVAGTILAVVAALYPARFAARMVPATALRSTV